MWPDNETTQDKIISIKPYSKCILIAGSLRAMSLAQKESLAVLNLSNYL